MINPKTMQRMQTIAIVRCQGQKLGVLQLKTKISLYFMHSQSQFKEYKYQSIIVIILYHYFSPETYAKNN